jgi:putative hydrolase of the HAD superfamily
MTLPAAVFFDLDETLVNRRESIKMNLSALWQRCSRADVDLQAFISAFHALDGWIVSEAFGVKKPHASIYRALLTRLDVAAENTWFIGDDPDADVRGPHGLGMKTAWIERHIPWPVGQDRCYTTECEGVSNFVDQLLTP